MKFIKLTKNFLAIVDDEDYDRLAQYKWRAHSSTNPYAIRNIKRNKKSINILMHRLILNIPDGMYCDHINMIKRDNRKSNLRICTLSQNQMNKNKCRNNKSGYKGVWWNKKDKSWRSVIRVNNRTLYLGSGKDKKKIAMLYNEAAKKYHGEFARLNQV